MLYPEKKKSQREWNKKHLKSLKDLEEKNKRIKEEKKNFISPELYKIQKFKNIPSKLKTDTLNWVNREQNNNKIFPKTPNMEQKRNYTNNRSKINNKEYTLNPILKPLTSNNDSRQNIINKTGEQGEENIYNILNNKTTTMFDTYYANKLKEKNMQNINNNNNQFNSRENINNFNNVNYNINTNTGINQVNSGNNNIGNDMNQFNTGNCSRNETIEKLIKEYKEKYGSDEALENMINEYYGKTGYNIAQDSINNDNNNNIIPKIQNNPNNNNILKDSIQKYEPNNDINDINNNNQIKPPIPSINDVPILLPKINKNYVKENIKLIVDNKIPQKKYINNNDIIYEERHKNFGKVPEYIKKYEQEREFERQEKIRKKLEMKYPKGTRLLSDEERIKTLNSLKKAQYENSLELEKMPITNRTIKLQKRKEELVKKLMEIDKAIEMFSKKQVFVKKQ